jgi:hypothetical protein
MAVADAAPGGEEAAPAGGAAESTETNEPGEATKRARSPASLGSYRGSSTRPSPVHFWPDLKRPRAYQGRGRGHGRPVAGIGGEDFAWGKRLDAEKWSVKATGHQGPIHWLGRQQREEQGRVRRRGQRVHGVQGGRRGVRRQDGGQATQEAALERGGEVNGLEGPE